MSETAPSVRVWDPFVRFFHWTLVAAFTVAYLSESEPYWLHVTAGFIVAGLVAVRIVWGFVGPQHARFSDFVYRPSTVFAYLKGLTTGLSKRYLGHSPAGGAMVIALLLALTATTGTGAYMYFAGAADEALAEGSARTSDDDEADEHRTSERERDSEEDAVEELHEFFANLTLFLVILHLGGVALASFAHRENLPRSMVTGIKRS